MEFKECVLSRRSIRKYEDRQIPLELLEEIIDEVRFAPSWANTRAIAFVCVKDPIKKAQLAEVASAYNEPFIRSASAVLAVTGIRNRAGIDRGGEDGAYYHKSKEWLMLDGGIAIQSLCLSAWDKGLGTLVMGDYKGEAVRELINLDEDRELIALVAIGYPAQSPNPPKRREVSEILTIM